MAHPGDSRVPDDYLGSLKDLEASIVRARESILRLRKENGALKAQIKKLRLEKRESTSRTKQLQENAKRSMMSQGRMNLAKSKIQKIIRRIEQVETEGEPARKRD